MTDSYLPLFPTSDLQNISRKSDLFQFLFFINDIYTKSNDISSIYTEDKAAAWKIFKDKFNDGIKYSKISKYYNDIKNKELLLSNYDFLPRSGYPVGLTIDFYNTKKMLFTYNKNQNFYCVFFQWGAQASQKTFEDYAKWLKTNKDDLLEMIKENIPIVFMGHSQGSASVLSVLNELCKDESINFKNIYGITLGLGNVSSPMVDLFSNNYNKYRFNYIDIMNFASVNIDRTELNRHIIERKDNYPKLGNDNDYYSKRTFLRLLNKYQKPPRCIDNFINNITVFNDSCMPLEDMQDYPYFCRNISKGIYGLPLKNPWYNNIPDIYKIGSNSPPPQNWIQNQRQHPYYSQHIDEILKLNEECSTRPTPSKAGLVQGPLIENKKNWGDYNSFQYNKCEKLFTMYHKHINVNTFGFLIGMNGQLTLRRINKQNIVKNLLLDDMENTGKIYHIRNTNQPAPTVYMWNENNNKMICQSNIGGIATGNAHEAATYRRLFIEYGTTEEHPDERPDESATQMGGYLLMRPIFY